MKKRIFAIFISATLVFAALALLGCGEEVTEPTTYGVIAEFDADKGSVTITDSSKAERRLFEPGEKATVTVKPKEGYIVKSFRINNVETELPESMVYSFTVEDTVRFKVVFEKPQSATPVQPGTTTAKKYAVKAEYDTGRGSVEITDLQGNHKNMFEENDTVKITAKANEDYEALTATIGNETLGFEKGVLTFKIKSSTTVKINFTIKTYTVTAQFDSELGSVTVCDNGGEEKSVFDKRETVTVTVVPEDTYAVYSVFVGGVQKDLDADGKIIFTALADTVVKVNFIKTFSVTAKFDSSLGDVTVCDENKKATDLFFKGQSVIITTTPKDGNKVLAVSLNDFTIKPAKTGVYTFDADEDVEFTVEFIPVSSPLTSALAAAASVKSYTVEVRGDEISYDIYHTENSAYYFFGGDGYGYGYFNGDDMSRDFEFTSEGSDSTEITAYHKNKTDLAALRPSFGEIDSTLFRRSENAYTVAFAGDVGVIHEMLTEKGVTNSVECPDGITIELRDGVLYKITYAYEVGETTAYTEDEDEGVEDGNGGSDGEEEEEPEKNMKYITFTFSHFGDTVLPYEIDMVGASTPVDQFVGNSGNAIYMNGDDTLTLDKTLGVAINGVYVDVVYDKTVGNGCHTVEYGGKIYGMKKTDDLLTLVQGSGSSVVASYAFAKFESGADISIDMHGSWQLNDPQPDQSDTLVISGKSVSIDNSGNMAVSEQKVILGGEILAIDSVSENGVNCHDSKGYFYQITLTGNQTISVGIKPPETMEIEQTLTFTKAD